jgi:hypothetical protein
MAASQKSVEISQGGLGLGVVVVVGRVLEGGSIMGGLVGVAEGKGNRWLMD